MQIEYKGKVTTHTFELEEMTAHMLFGYLWEALEKLDGTEDVGVRMQAAASTSMHTLAKALNIDYVKYTGTDYLKPTDTPSKPV